MICDAYMPRRWYQANLAVFFLCFATFGTVEEFNQNNLIFKDNTEFILDSEKC